MVSPEIVAINHTIAYRDARVRGVKWRSGRSGLRTGNQFSPAYTNSPETPLRGLGSVDTAASDNSP